VKVGLGEKVSFTSAANHLAAQLSITQDFKANADRRVGISAVGETNGADAPTDGIRKSGKIYTGFYPNFHALSKADKRAVFDERDAKGVESPGNRGGRGGARRGGGKRSVSAAAKKEKEKEFNDLKSQIGGVVKKQIISALKRQKEPESESDEDDSDPKDDAGTGFGGRTAKKSIKFQKGTKRGKKKE
jgi:hypothetical protein